MSAVDLLLETLHAFNANRARSLLTRLDRDELLEEIVSQYIENLE